MLLGLLLLLLRPLPLPPPPHHHHHHRRRRLRFRRCRPRSVIIIIIIIIIIISSSSSSSSVIFSSTLSILLPVQSTFSNCCNKLLVCVIFDCVPQAYYEQLPQEPRPTSVQQARQDRKRPDNN